MNLKYLEEAFNLSTPVVTVTEALPGSWRALKAHGVDYITNVRREVHLVILICHLCATMNLVTPSMKLLTV